MIDFALRLTREPSSVKREDLDVLKQRGFSEEQVVDIVLITCTSTSWTASPMGSALSSIPRCNGWWRRMPTSGNRA